MPRRAALPACSGRWDAPLLSAARYLQGLGVHLAVGWAQAHAVGALPWPLEPAAAALCASARRLAMAIEVRCTPHSSRLPATGRRQATAAVHGQLARCPTTPLHPIIACLQYAHMGLLLLFGGLAKGFAQGALL